MSSDDEPPHDFKPTFGDWKHCEHCDEKRGHVNHSS